jgi:hypothetical protein
MAIIPLEQSRRVFTIGFLKSFDELVTDVAPTFFSSFFKDAYYSTLGTTLKARRGNRKIAVDVVLGSKGNYNQATKFTEKMVIPGYYLEKQSITAMDIYDIPFESAEGAVNVAQIKALAEQTANELFVIVQKVIRAKELQAAQVFDNGIVQYKHNENIDFKRKPEMIEVLSGTDLWDATGVDIISYFEGVAEKLGRIGKVVGGQRVSCVMGLLAWQAFRKNPAIKDANNYVTISNLTISEKMKQATGASQKGVLNAGGYEFDIFVYTEVYEDAEGAEQTYWDSKSVVCIPESFRGEMSHCQVPELPSWITKSTRAKSIMSARPAGSKGFTFSDYVDEESDEWVGRIKTRVVAQPVSVDKIHTAKVLN